MSDLLSYLADEDRLARRSDPATSKAAVRGDNFGPLTIRVLRALVEVEGDRGATRNELLRVLEREPLPPDLGSVSRRLTSLMRRGFVRDTGMTRDGGRGVRVRVYASTREGREWLR